MKNKRVAPIALLLCVVLTASACTWQLYEDKSGFSYYVDKYHDGELCIVEIPDDETVVIPEEINGIPVRALGCRVAEPFNIHDVELISDTLMHLVLHGYVDPLFSYFPNLLAVSFIDPLSASDYRIYPCGRDHGAEHIIDFDFYTVGGRDIAVELLTEGKPVATDVYRGVVIELSKNVKTIEKGVFEGLEDVRFRTAFREDEVPDGWEKGWNEGLPVEWDAVLFDKDRDCENGWMPDEGVYYFTDDAYYVYGFEEGVDAVELPRSRYVFKTRLGYLGSDTYHTPVLPLSGKGIKSLTLTTPTEVCAVEDFDDLETLIFKDPVYIFSLTEGTVCRIEAPAELSPREIHLTVPPNYYVISSKDSANAAITTYEIPRGVTVIKKDVFAYANPDAVLKVAYREDEIPEGWEEGWNSGLAVEYGVSLD